MEDVMYFHRFWKVEPIGLLANLVDYPIWTIVLPIKFFCWTSGINVSTVEIDEKHLLTTKVAGY